MGETADWLEAHPWEDPDLMNEMFNEFLDQTGWRDIILQAKTKRKRAKLIEEARADFLGSMESSWLSDE